MVLLFSSPARIKYKKLERSYFFLILIFLLLEVSCKQNKLSSNIPIAANRRLEQGILRIALNSDPVFLDWNKVSDITSATMIIHLMRGLYAVDNKGNAVPDLLESETHNKDFTQFQFKLKPNVSWSDGQAFEAQHVFDSWVRLLTPQTAASKAEDFWIIKNGRKFQLGQINDPSLLGIKVIDHLNLEVTLESSFPSFPFLLTRVWTFPIRKDLIVRWGERWADAPHLTTLGPYVLQSWQHDYKLIIKANPYYATPPFFKTIECLVIQSLEARRDLFDNFELDYGDHVPLENYNQFIGRPEFKQSKDIGIYYLRFNTRKSPTQNKALRQALTLALDKRQIVSILGGAVQAASSYLIPSIPEFEANLSPEFDKAAAQKVLSDHKINPSQIKLTLGLNSNVSQRLIMENVQHQWKQNLGINAVLQESEWKVYLQQVRLDPPPVYRMSFISGLTAYDYLKKFEPETVEAISFSSPANAVSYASLMQQLLLAPTLEQRRKAASAAQIMLLKDEWALIPLYYVPGNDLIHGYLENVIIRGDTLVDFSKASFKK